MYECLNAIHSNRKKGKRNGCCRVQVRATRTTGGGDVDEAVVQAKRTTWETTRLFNLP
jgi:hypothetical protein